MQQNKGTKIRSDLKLVNWVHDGFPPIDLNQQATRVKELVTAYDQLLKDNKELVDDMKRIMVVYDNVEDLAGQIARKAYDKHSNQ